MALDLESIKRVYARYARVYDLLFGPTFAMDHKQAVAAAHLSPGERVLEAGVGTGLSLPLYPAGVKVVGVDYSPAMLEVARRRSTAAEVELLEMNAQALSFPDASFDACLSMHVVNVVPDEKALARELFRVTRPGGRIILVGRFSRPGHWTSALDRLMNPLARILGWKPLFYLDEFLAAFPPAQVSTSPCGLSGQWTLVEVRRP